MTKTALLAVSILAALAACGGKRKTEDTTPEGPTISNRPGDTTDRSASMFPPEKMDEINRLLERKRPTVSRCLTMAVDNQELPKNSRGKVTLGMTISPAGKAGSIKVIKTSLESKALTDCVIGKVQEIQFPDLPKPYETSYTYAFEAIQ
ncbi:MAG: AgmX/PglI C-terminal domain-containing protein [Deltaproteobacteria bacterium]|nr:AgmX/PglI C-terminal domain-containing protein [Deltaproteobacteria bacterium]MDQ3299188.1 AgmX/PglI C-terminal domain-containing protein [Myxococcota bacterium]